MSGILERRESAWIGSRRGLIVCGGHVIGEGFMRPVFVVLVAKAIKAPLLRRESGRRGPRRPGFEDAMKLFVRPVLIRAPHRDVFDGDPQPQPPNIELP